MYEYPYGNSQQLNLDWILNKLKKFENSGASSADMKSIANALLSASYDAGSEYAVNDVVYNDTLETLYICNTAIPVGGEPWDATHWDAFRVGEVLTLLFNTIQNLSSDDIANNSNVTGTGLTAALNALVEDVRYNNHYLQQKKNGVYANVIPIEDTPSNNSDRLASSKAAYDLKGAITATQNEVGYVLGATTAGRSVLSGSYVIYNNALYKATQNIASTDTAPYTGKITSASNIGEDVKFLNNWTMKKNIDFSVPANGTKTIHFDTSDYSFILCTKSTSVLALTNVLLFVAGYSARADRGKVVNISGNTEITLDMSADTPQIVVHNNNGAGIQLLLIPLGVFTTYTFT